MDKASGKIDSPEEMSSPMLLNSLDFPPLQVSARPETLITSSSSKSSMTTTVSPRALSKKRPMKDEEAQLSDEDSLAASQSSESLSSSNSHIKKSRKLSYREPPPVLQSLDSDAFKALFESPTLSDSQNSESGLFSPSWSSSRVSTRNSSQENLGSLGDIIQKYSVATLDSFKALETPDSSQTNYCLASPEATQNETPGISRELPVLFNTAGNDNIAKFHTNKTSTSISSDTRAPEEHSQDEYDHSSKQPCLMSITFDTRNASDLALNKALPDQVTEPTSFETLASTSAEHNTPKYLDTEESKANVKTSDSSDLQSQEEKPESKLVYNDSDTNTDSSDDDEDDESSATELYETDLKKYQRCKKNKTHLKFFSVPELQVRDLPEEIQHDDSVTFLSCLSQLVVQITVHSTSKARGPDDMYSNYIGTNKKRNGSGFIASLDEDIRRYRCKREDCPHDDFNSSFEDSGSMPPPRINRSGSTVSSNFDRSMSNISTASSSSTSSSGNRGMKHFFYGGVYIHTNKHVIFDKSEADNAYIKFFYNTPQQKEVVNGHVAAIVGVNSFQDHVVLHVMSHEKSLFTTIGMCLHNAESSYKQMLQSTEKINHILNHKQSWVAIISHPHGMAKTVTFGHVKKETTESTRIIKYYDAPTCPGSSGGLVITPSLLRLQWPGAVHSCFDRISGYNITFDSRFPDLDSSDMGRIHKTVLSSKHSYPDDIFKL